VGTPSPLLNDGPLLLAYLKKTVYHSKAVYREPTLKDVSLCFMFNLNSFKNRENGSVLLMFATALVVHCVQFLSGLCPSLLW
jgi:hypothetical protein